MCATLHARKEVRDMVAEVTDRLEDLIESMEVQNENYCAILKGISDQLCRLDNTLYVLVQTIGMREAKV